MEWEQQTFAETSLLGQPSAIKCDCIVVVGGAVSYSCICIVVERPPCYERFTTRHCLQHVPCRGYYLLALFTVSVGDSLVGEGNGLVFTKCIELYHYLVVPWSNLGFRSREGTAVGKGQVAGVEAYDFHWLACLLELDRQFEWVVSHHAVDFQKSIDFQVTFSIAVKQTDFLLAEGDVVDSKVVQHAIEGSSCEGLFGPSSHLKWINVSRIDLGPCPIGPANTVEVNLDVCASVSVSDVNPAVTQIEATGESRIPAPVLAPHHLVATVMQIS